jgi:hypothetical protein
VTQPNGSDPSVTRSILPTPERVGGGRGTLRTRPEAGRHVRRCAGLSLLPVRSQSPGDFPQDG